MQVLTDNILFGLFISIAAFLFSVWLRGKLGWSWLNPLLLSIVSIVLFLLVTQIPYTHFAKGSAFIRAMLGPVTVVLALPLYRQRKLLIKHKYAIIGGVTSGALSAIISVIVLCRWLGLTDLLERSLLPHSVTTPIGIGITQTLQGIEGITVFSIIITGVFGALIAPLLLKLLRITHPIAKGIGIGTASHAIGTSKALEMGETEGAMSGLAIGLAAIITVIMVVILGALGY